MPARLPVRAAGASGSTGDEAPPAADENLSAPADVLIREPLASDDADYVVIAPPPSSTLARGDNDVDSAVNLNDPSVPINLTQADTPLIKRAENVALLIPADDTIIPAASGENAGTVSDSPTDAGITDSIGKSKNQASGSSWSVNIASFQQEDQAADFVSDARSKGVDATSVGVVVRGRDYWRVTVTGFATAAAARIQAEQIRNKLGVSDVWIARK